MFKILYDVIYMFFFFKFEVVFVFITNYSFN